MRTLIIADVHANLTALQTVLEDAAPFDRVWCLGDVVGYGPDPNECISLARELPQLKCVKGNHDAAILGEISVLSFNYEARASIQWLESVISSENRDWLRNLEEKHVLQNVTLVHGSPNSPVWEYVMDVRTAQENMDSFNTPVCLVGHTHIPCVYVQEEGALKSTRMYGLDVDQPLMLNHKSILNPGSVGQPRDHDPRASYLIYDDDGDRWFYHRVPYDVVHVQNRIMEAGLPVRHAQRLSQGW
ncbi:MAG: metallophosphoesterase family protein [Chloroflexota bacterium]|nr:metallophosphoesterase family protein [Chloroflexota bacterium]